MNDCSTNVRCLRTRCLARRRKNSGFTLLEILITTAILVVGLTVAFHTTRSAVQRMMMARELTEAQNACQAVLNELLARTAPIEPHEGRAAEHLPNWKIRVDIYPAPQPGLFVLHLSAQQFSSYGRLLGVRYQLIRWVSAERVRLPEPEPLFVPFDHSPFDSLFQ